MANNTARYGFRWVGSADGACYPKPVEKRVASAYQAQVSATDVDLNIGDPVDLVNDGTIALATGAGSPSTLYGVIVGFANVKVGLPLAGRKYNRLPGGTTYTLETDVSKALVVPFGRNYWEVDVDDNTTATTLAAYRLLCGENANLSYTLDISDTSRPKATPRLDISTHVATTADFRIIEISKTALNQDFSGTGVKLIVQVNESGEAPFVTAGV